jgi:hypothetical protein
MLTGWLVHRDAEPEPASVAKRWRMIGRFVMLCQELELLEGKLDEIVTAMEDLSLTEEQKEVLEKAYARMCHEIDQHQMAGHKGSPCYEE